MGYEIFKNPCIEQSYCSIL
uniref:Uncharacterized protein n=1 Tax=Rhizophora mucronata TaxID=61149 RepID=A0A2P2R5E4_RHIMU